MVDTLNQGQSDIASIVANGATNGTVPVWNGPDPSTGVTVTPASDGMSATIAASPTATPGTYTVTVSSQAASGNTFSSSFSLVVEQPQATAFTFVFSTPT